VMIIKNVFLRWWY